ncbi:MAG TPA: primosomal protein N' [Dehalococcoidia bacterium]|nr:primosomal protein N' [Dehalococcoidia bacterium]
MKYAEVSVNSPVAQRRAFSYAIPPHLNVEVGQAVWVPFGERTLQGIVMALTPHPAVEETRDIIDVIESRPLLSPIQLQLARWISDYYLSPLFDAVALMLPPGFERRTLTFVSAVLDSDEQSLSSLTPPQRQALALLQNQEKVNTRELEKKLGIKKAQAIISQLVRKGLATRSYEIEPIKMRPKTVPFLRLNVPLATAREISAELKGRRALKQAGLLDFLSESTGSIPWTELRQKLGIERATADALVRRGLIAFETVEVKREPISYQDIAPTSSPQMTRAQEVAFSRIGEAMHGDKTQPGVFLLHGVTGSGKTEIYLRALAETVKSGRRGIVLVPEIALTLQTIERFASRFPRRVAVLHSKLSPGEQYDEWRRIRDGEFDVVIGPRSALFSPQPDLGLIVLDEEHEWTYKQENPPRYHARDVAMKLAELTGAVVILGSATPDVNTYFRARQGSYELLQLPQRVVPVESAPLPHVDIVDMREELKAGNRSIFSRALSQAMTQAINGGEQAILFLNRRGGATFIQCRRCGFVLRCHRCEVPLTHHYTEDVLVCHQCNYRTAVPDRCPRCFSRQMKYLGLGTQKVEQEVSYALPGARLLRWDSDMTRSKESHEKILRQFRDHKADILIGTQMVAKGLDLPRVTLVGVVSADTSLNLPDFRAGERTFQLLSQVAGRAGRGPLGGQVIIQTFSPEHYAIRAAANHDYLAFYEREIDYRRQLHNPPFSRLATLTYSHINNAICQREAEKMRNILTLERDARGISALNLIGPAPAFIHRLRGRYRWQIILRGTELSSFLSQITFPQGWAIDIDPVSLL